jgi:hypothetical protein
MAAAKTAQLPVGSELDAQIAERIMGWKEVHPLDQARVVYRGKKQDRAGRWRSARVPDYSTEPSLASEVEERIKELGLFERYMDELAKIAQSRGLPAGWASPAQRCRAALKTVRSKHKRNRR